MANSVDPDKMPRSAVSDLGCTICSDMSKYLGKYGIQIDSKISWCCSSCGPFGSGFETPFGPLLCLIEVFVIMCVSLVRGVGAGLGGSGLCLSYWTAAELEFQANKRGLPPRPYPFSPGRFLCCGSFLFVRRWFHIWRLFYDFYSLVSPSFSASRKLHITKTCLCKYVENFTFKN